MAKTKNSIRKSANQQHVMQFQVKNLVPGLFVLVFAIIGVSFIVGGNAESKVPNYVCDFGSPNGQACMNAKQSGTSNGTEVLGWSKDYDANENFIIQPLSSMCLDGHVTLNCPFTPGSGLNNRYLGDEIIQFVDVQSRYADCLGNSDSSMGVLVACNTPNGIGGGIGSVFVLNKDGKGTAGLVESQYWSDENFDDSKEFDTPAWLCMTGPPEQGQVNVTTSPPMYSSECKWGMDN